MNPVGLRERAVHVVFVGFFHRSFDVGFGESIHRGGRLGVFVILHVTKVLHSLFLRSVGGDNLTVAGTLVHPRGEFALRVAVPRHMDNVGSLHGGDHAKRSHLGLFHCGSFDRAILQSFGESFNRGLEFFVGSEVLVARQLLDGVDQEFGWPTGD